MQISRDDVIRVFQDLLTDRVSREAADRWANSIMRAFDEKEIEFLPPSDEDCIWSGVMYLYGIDLEIQPGEYMYSEEDIRSAMLKNFAV
jgi:hypothetical protein